MIRPPHARSLVYTGAMDDGRGLLVAILLGFYVFGYRPPRRSAVPSCRRAFSPRISGSCVITKASTCLLPVVAE